jgi:uncharacterized protein YggE
MENVNNQDCNKMCGKWSCCGGGKCGSVLKWVIIAIAVIIVLRMIGGGHRLSSDRPVNTITVSGKGEIVVKPDIAMVSFGVSAENADVSKAQSESAEKINKILAFLKDKGVEEKDIKTTNYNIYPRYDYVKSAMDYYGGKQVLAGYVVSQSLEVKIRKIEDAGAIIGGVGQFGVTDVSGLSFTLDEIDEKNDEARDAAIKDAREQAKVLARSLGVRLGDITSFSENGNYPRYYAVEKAVTMSAAADSVAPAIPAGENKITSGVTITYEIK